MISRASLCVLVACVGCAEAGAPPVATMPAPRHAGAWQQFCEQAVSVPQASQLVAARGADGWELVAMYNGVLCFKRPAPALVREARPAAVPTPAPTVPFVPLVRDPGF